LLKLSALRDTSRDPICASAKKLGWLPYCYKQENFLSNYPMRYSIRVFVLVIDRIVTVPNGSTVGRPRAVDQSCRM